MPNDAKLGLVVGVGLVIAIGVIFFRKEPAPTTTPAVTPPAGAMVAPQRPAPAKPAGFIKPSEEEEKP